MQHTKSFIASEDTKSAIEYLYKEIEALERRIDELEDEVESLKY